MMNATNEGVYTSIATAVTQWLQGEGLGLVISLLMAMSSKH